MNIEAVNAGQSCCDPLKTADMMTVSILTKLYAGITLLLMITIESGGLFLLPLLKGKGGFTPYQRAMFRVGHAHAGVLSILCLVAQLFVDALNIDSTNADHLARIGFAAAALLISGGFFAAAAGKGLTRPNKLIGILYAGAAILAVSLLVLALLLILST